MRAKTFLSVLALVLLTSGLNLYWGMPLHTGGVKRTTLADPVDRFLLPPIAEAMASTAGFLDDVGIPSGALRNAPAISVFSQLGIADALVNVWTSVTIALVAFVVGLATGVKVLLISIMQFKILAVLGIALAIVMAPVLAFLTLALVLVNVAYQESSVAYLAITFSLAILACIPAVAMFLHAIAFVRRWIVELVSRRATGMAAGVSRMRSEWRVHKVGLEYEKQLRETQSAMAQPEIEEEMPQESSDDEEQFPPAVSQRWENLLEEQDMEALIAEGDSIAELDKAEDVSGKHIGQLFDEGNVTAGEYLASVAAAHEEVEEEELLIGDDDKTGINETLKDMPAKPGSQGTVAHEAPRADDSDPVVEEGAGDGEIEDFTGTFGTLNEIPGKSATQETFGFHAKSVDEVETTGEDSEPAVVEPAVVEPAVVEPVVVEPAAAASDTPLDFELPADDADEEVPETAKDSPTGKKPTLPEKRFRGTLTHHDRKKT